MRYNKNDIYTDKFIDIIKRYIKSAIIETFECDKFPYIQICMMFYGIYKKPSPDGCDYVCIPFYQTINCFSEDLINKINDTAYRVQMYLHSKLDDTFEDTFEISYFKEYPGDIVKYFTYQNICPNYVDFPFLKIKMNSVDFFIKYNTLKHYGNVTQFFKQVFMTYGNGYKWKNGKIQHDPKRVIDHYISEEDMYNDKVEQYSQIYNLLKCKIKTGTFDDNIKLRAHVLGIINDHENKLQRIHDFIYKPDIEFNIDDLKDCDIYHTQFTDSDLISNIPDNIHPTWKKHIRNFYDVIYKYIIDKCPENVEHAKKLYGDDFFNKIEHTISNF